MTSEPRADDLELTDLTAPMAATIAAVRVAEGDEVRTGSTVVVLEVMKMEHPVTAPFPGRIHHLAVRVGDTVAEHQTLASIEPIAAPPDDDPDALDVAAATTARTADERADLADLRAARSHLLDTARPAAVAKVHGRGRRTARENVADLCDDGSFHEYGALAYAAQEHRRSREDLIANTPADGLVTGLGRINGHLFEADRSTCAVAAYDYTVLAGTQGWRNHHKKDRLFEIAANLGIPLVLFAEGGGGRPGDTDVPVVSGLDTRAFELFARLSGRVPTVGIASGRCFAGNAALLGCCDVIIATADATIGMAGPAMIDGGGLGRFRPDDIGPIDVQVANGVVDVAVDDDARAVATAKRYLAFFQGPVDDWAAADQTTLRTLVPEHRKSVYDVRAVIETLADTSSTLELRRGFGKPMITTLARLGGRAVGIIANDPGHLGGAIDRDAADKAARFLGMCDVHGLPVLFLCDTPGFMVGPEAETTAQVRHFARMFVTAAAMRVPFGTVVLRKGYGLGAQAMAGGSFRAGLFTLSWPTGEFGGMGLEGAVRLGFRSELEAIDDEAERQRTFESMVEAAYRRGRAVNMAAHLELDDVIDPVETRARVIDAFAAAGPVLEPARRFVDPW
jgi:acetyl-CoA carboxylase carboxyltransferase component